MPDKSEQEGQKKANDHNDPNNSNNPEQPDQSDQPVEATEEQKQTSPGSNSVDRTKTNEKNRSKAPKSAKTDPGNAKPESDQNDKEIETDSETEVTKENAEEVERRLKMMKKKKEVKKYLDKSEDGAEFWAPKTRLGELVKNGEITNIKDALATGLPVREPEIIDILLPDLDDEVLDVNMVQRMTDSGRRVRFAIMTVVGNGNGYVGLGSSKGKEVGPAIRKAIDNAKTNIIEIRRGCGSWECGCNTPHTLPFMVNGKSGSTEVTFRPAPRGVGLAVGDVAKHILRLGGIEDAWGFTRGQTRTTINYAKAVFEALHNTAKLKTMGSQIKQLNIMSGAIEQESESEHEENEKENIAAE